MTVTITTDGQRLLQILAELPEIRHAASDETGNRILLVCDQDRPEGMILARAREAMAAAGMDPGGVELVVSYLAVQGPPRRARFLGVELDRPHVGAVRAVVRLEWQGKEFTGTAEGEATIAGEMRTSANAAIAALEAVIEGAARFSLVGIKAIRIFDTDFVTVLLQSGQGVHGDLIGASLVSRSSHRAAALAVLNATNRMLGNFLATPE